MLSYSGTPTEQHITFTLMSNKFIVRHAIAANITGIGAELGNTLQLDRCGEKRPLIHMASHSHASPFWPGLSENFGARSLAESSENTTFLCLHT